jgi:hypothetical protein
MSQDFFRKHAPFAPTVETHRSLADYLAARETMRDALEARGAVERAVARLARLAPFQYLCHAHGGIATLRIDADAGDEVNWRESVVCPQCQLNARMRFCTGVLAQWMTTQPGARLYLTEQATRGYALLKHRFGNVRGSEFIHDEQRRAAVDQYIRHITADPAEKLHIEDVTRLSFADESFEMVASFEVLEHVPDYRLALREMARVLGRDGQLLLTAPFLDLVQDTVTRARLNPDGSITHLLPPEYHGDPVSDGVLCFHHFGWDLLDALREAGFATAEVVSAWAPGFGLMGTMQAIAARKT